MNLLHYTYTHHNIRLMSMSYSNQNPFVLYDQYQPQEQLDNTRKYLCPNKLLNIHPQLLERQRHQIQLSYFHNILIYHKRIPLIRKMHSCYLHTTNDRKHKYNHLSSDLECHFRGIYSSYSYYYAMHPYDNIDLNIHPLRRNYLIRLLLRMMAVPKTRRFLQVERNNKLHNLHREHIDSLDMHL
tara:strand:+ start:229 stop:780 length:552 start_codon:yes stop_codon:yes gene_type:complete